MGKKEKITKNIATLVKKYRKIAKYSQTQAGKQFNVSRQTISAYECENTDVPMSSLISFAMQYKIPLDELLLALCNSEEEQKYVKDNYPNIDDPIRNLLLTYMKNVKIDYSDAEFLSKNDDDGQALRIGIEFTKAVVKRSDKTDKK